MFFLLSDEDFSMMRSRARLCQELGFCELSRSPQCRPVPSSQLNSCDSSIHLHVHDIHVPLYLLAIYDRMCCKGNIMGRSVESCACGVTDGWSESRPSKDTTCCATRGDIINDRHKASKSSAANVGQQKHDPLILFGIDLSHLPSSAQLLLCVSGVVFFTVIYGYLQELLLVHIAGRQYGLFLASCQFGLYAFWSMVLTRLRSYRHGDAESSLLSNNNCKPLDVPAGNNTVVRTPPSSARSIPLLACVGLSLIRALDLSMTNLAMQYVNYPTKVLVKSSKVAFTMLLGLVITNKRYKCRDYLSVSLLVFGLGIFLHADSRASVVFHSVGILLLVGSLVCDGILGNASEKLMRQYHVGQDEYLLQLYTIAFVAVTIAAHAKGELVSGLEHLFLKAGTVPEIQSGVEFQHHDLTWTVRQKVLVLFFFSTTGLLGSSCAGAITKRFGALTMSITSTARKAMTIFVSFVAFHNTCTFEHVAGMTIFLSALIMKSVYVKADTNSNGGTSSSKTMEEDDDSSAIIQDSSSAKNGMNSEEGKCGDACTSTSENKREIRPLMRGHDSFDVEAAEAA